MALFPLSITNFYLVAAEERTEVTLANPSMAIKFRLRLYNYWQRHKELPRLTISVVGSTVIAGPEGFDLVGQLAEFSPSTIEAMERKEKEAREEVMGLLESFNDKPKQLKKEGEETMQKLGFGVEKEKEKDQALEKDIDPYSNPDPYALPDPTKKDAE